MVVDITQAMEFTEKAIRELEQTVQRKASVTEVHQHRSQAVNTISEYRNILPARQVGKYFVTIGKIVREGGYDLDNRE